MKMIYAEEVSKELDFARRAAERFAKDEKLFTYGDIESGGFLALRWGLGEDCVVVVKIDSDHIPTNYQQLIREYLNEKAQ